MGRGKSKLFSDWQEFLREFIIIVLGVLTALIAQEWVQSMEWRNKVRAAIANMNQELSNGNGPQAYVRLAVHQCLADRLQATRAAINAGDRAMARRQIDVIDLPLRNYNSHAREAANSSDIAAHIPADTMYEYRIVYALVPEMDDVHRGELEHLAELRSLPASGGPLSQQEKHTALAAVENLMLDNDRMKRASAFTLRHMRDLEIGVNRPQLRRNFADVPIYGNCLTSDIGPMIDLSPPTGAR
ncbi:MAG TPA: hypothetical protein VJM15_10225 [Sphingomicrobium sp.]|nr:hypothetical protein [Sphingomicrobium sp.]